MRRIVQTLRALLCLSLLSLALPAQAVQPDEILEDPALEERARDISTGLRCLVCRNENIDDSNADLARDLRLLVRERLVAGDSDEEVVDFIVARYGEYVLLQPRAGGSNLVLWLAGPAMLLLGVGIGLGYIRRRGRARSMGEAETLSAEEEARLKEILKN
ncbi:Cytochrome c-type biogenesis protein CcmH precursor [Pseudooceanicola marinus]|uniref:Cytochrome c-type biogenesis protein n=1 Tax=Pseudooceanicola marinus TaxID=396013 RepID=A0A1X6YR64_9RHOB|nr:cytochrome c-type biogenesis protein [Pseudooceanicola marinus]PJE29486.1 cytochrome c-type biogenesis protein CcmH [Pseudooceanicola marinus]SLN26989.1 Cytochrome c-type biogenesis protein CcmH precursor [Pseudooceanicola marinus]